MPEAPLENAIFFMIRAYLDSELTTIEHVRGILQRVQDKVIQYDALRNSATAVPKNNHS